MLPAAVSAYKFFTSLTSLSYRERYIRLLIVMISISNPPPIVSIANFQTSTPINIKKPHLHIHIIICQPLSQFRSISYGPSALPSLPGIKYESMSVHRLDTKKTNLC